MITIQIHTQLGVSSEIVLILLIPNFSVESEELKLLPLPNASNVHALFLLHFDANELEVNCLLQLLDALLLTFLLLIKRYEFLINEALLLILFCDDV